MNIESIVGPIPQSGFLRHKKEKVRETARLDANRLNIQLIVADEQTIRQDRSDDILNQLILNMKALMLLEESQESLDEIIEKNLINSHDEQIQRFVKLTQPKRKRVSTRGYFLMAAGELILASFLMIAGLATVLPSVLELKPEGLLNFIGQITSGITVQTLSNPLVPGLELMLAVLLLFGAFHTVRLAALNLRELGVLPRPKLDN